MVSVTPTGSISFLPSCYGGRSIHKFITKDSGFYDLLERDDEVMTDRGFRIQEDVLIHFCRPVVPLWKIVKNQMTKFGVKKRANLRIHVVRAINWIQFFRIFKETILVTMIQHVDDIILTCATLSNFNPKLLKIKEKDSHKYLLTFFIN